MLFKNTKPLKKQKKTLYGDAADLAALRALAGLHCSVCDQPLRSEDYKGSWGYKRKYSAYTCCGIAHCPYCGASAKENCPHLVATRASGNWHIHGLPEVAGMPLPNPAPLTPDSLLDHSDTQKKNAYAAAHPLLEAMFHYKWYGKTIEKIPPHLLVTDVLKPDNHQEVNTANGITNQYYFSQNTAGIAERFESALIRDLPEAFTRLAAQPVPHTEHLQHAFAVEGVLPFEEITFVGYSPDGKSLVVLTDARGEFWDVSGAVPKRTARFNAMAGTENLKYMSARFSETGDVVQLLRHSDGYSFHREPLQVETRALPDGDLLCRRTSMAQDLAIHDSLPSSRGRSAEIHQGKTVVTTRTNKIRVHRLNDQGKKTGNLCIPLRRPVSHLAVFGEGDTFVTAGDRFVCFWRVPQDMLSCSQRHPKGK